MCIAHVSVRSADCCRPAAASCAAGYAWGEDGSNQCPKSYYAIVNEAACETAAAAAGKAYRGIETVPYLPSGCYIYQQEGGGFYLNADAVGAGVPGAQLLCSGAAHLARPAEAPLVLLGYSRGTRRATMGHSRDTMGHSSTPVCRIGAQGGARRGTWVGLARCL